MLEKIQKFREYLDYIERHYLNVQKAWKLIQEKCKDKGFTWLKNPMMWFDIDHDVTYHDQSKLSVAEFTQYRQKCFPVEGELVNDKAYLSAWEHHKLNNTHHWQNWTQRSDLDTDERRDRFVVMMLVDWVAMSFEFGDTAKQYYEKNREKIELPDWAVQVMYDIFDCLYPESNS